MGQVLLQPLHQPSTIASTSFLDVESGSKEGKEFRTLAGSSLAHPLHFKPKPGEIAGRSERIQAGHVFLDSLGGGRFGLLNVFFVSLGI